MEIDFNDIINNVNVYGFDEAVLGSKYPMAVDLDKLNNDVTNTVIKLAQSQSGAGHDTFLNGIIVTFDLLFSNKAWVELERYKFINFVSSQSTMHRITKFNLDAAYNEYVDPKIIDIMKEKVAYYNFNSQRDGVNQEELKKAYLEILYSNPAGFRLTAKLTTNYRQLKTIYQQRKDHRLPE